MLIQQIMEPELTPRAQVKEAGVMKDAPADWAKATLLTRQTTNLSDVSSLPNITAAQQTCSLLMRSTLLPHLSVAATTGIALQA